MGSIQVRKASFEFRFKKRESKRNVDTKFQFPGWTANSSVIWNSWIKETPKLLITGKEKLNLWIQKKKQSTKHAKSKGRIRFKFPPNQFHFHKSTRYIATWQCFVEGPPKDEPLGKFIFTQPTATFSSATSHFLLEFASPIIIISLTLISY